KECLRDTIVDFMSGNTNIPTIDDEIGDPSQGTSSIQSASGTSIGFNCPADREDVADGFDLSTCSIRFGDIFHSVPVLVGSPSPLFFDVGFQNFALNFLSRPAAAYVGSNDGFLHGFHAGNLVAPGAVNPFTLATSGLPFFNQGSGRETFAFAPPTFLEDSEAAPSGLTSEDFRFGNFKNFVLGNETQRAFFDGSPTVGDIWIDGYSNGISGASNPNGEIAENGSEWHTVLVAGFRNGGGGFTALDLTNFGCGNIEPPDDPDDPDFNFTTVTDTQCSSLESGNADLTFMDTNGPGYPEHLWTLFDEHIGNTWSEPTFGRVRLNVGTDEDAVPVDRWVAFVGGGIDPTDTNPRNGVGLGNAFYVIDIATGQIIFKFHPSGSLTNDDDMVCEMAGRINVTDLNSDGFVDIAYGGDTCGRLWRFDVSTPLETSSGIGSTGRIDTAGGGSAVITAPNWTGSIAFCTGTGCKVSDTQAQIPPNATVNLQSIYSAPTIAIDDLGRRHVIFQTGTTRDILRIAQFNDNGTPDNFGDDFPIDGTFQFGRLYNFIDDFVPAFLAGGSSIGGNLRSEADLLPQLVTLTIPGNTFTNNEFNDENSQFQISPNSNFEQGRGEFIVEYPNNENQPRGEKGIGTPVVIDRVLFFTSFAPFLGEENPCEPAPGQGRIFALDFVTGAPAFARIPGSNVFLDENIDNSLVAGVSAGKGVPTVPQLTFGKRGSVIATIALSGEGGAEFLIINLGFFPTRTQTLFWEEII
ncbi:MAG: pilus assembly protein, partial [Thermodesulfobacteriota bacterium]